MEGRAYEKIIKYYKSFLFLLALLIACVEVPAEVLAESSPGEVQLTMEDLQALNGGTVLTDLQNGKVAFVGGTCTDTKVTSMEDAQKCLLPCGP